MDKHKLDCKRAREVRRDRLKQKRLQQELSRRSYSLVHDALQCQNKELSTSNRDPGGYFKRARKFRKDLLGQRRTSHDIEKGEIIGSSRFDFENTATTSGNQCGPSTSGASAKKTKKKNRLDDFSKPWNFGGPNKLCSDCGAFVWEKEQVQKEVYKQNPKYSICCEKGKISLPLLQKPPPYLAELLKHDGGPRSSKFRDNIRSYNSMFAFSSMGGHVDNTYNDGQGPYIFRINGQNHHKIGTLLPPDGKQPQFIQLYMYDTDNEVSNRIDAVCKGRQKVGSSIDPDIVHGLSVMINEVNPLAQLFRMAKDRFDENQIHPVKIQLIASRAKDGRQYNLPTSDEIAALIVGDGEQNKGKRDIIVDMKGYGLQRITELHPSFMAMQYPLLFPYAQDGFRVDIPHSDAETNNKRKRRKVTIREYYAYRFQHRPHESHVLLSSGKLSQQLIVDAFTCIEETKLDYIRSEQKKFRTAVMRGLQDAVFRGDTASTSIGRRVILPSSYTGSPRNIFQNYQDAMAICRWAGPPDLFVTFTCNPKWPEIIEAAELIPGQKAQDRPDLIARVFKLKLDGLKKDLTDGGLFGKTKAFLYTIEFQKRGLPHAHMLIFLDEKCKPQTSTQIDNIISAELPDKDVDPIGYEAVLQFMVHGPCGPYNMHSPCMNKGRCTKNYPKPFVVETTISEDGYPLYRRRDDGKEAQKGDVVITNRNVIPHNLKLLIKYQAHINVEWCNKSRSIKYLFKYMNKGHDKALATVEEVQPRRGNDTQNSDIPEYDEIKRFLNCRYVSASEACWRIYAFPIQYKEPPVQRLTYHLPGEQSVVFDDSEDLERVLQRANFMDTSLTQWFETNKLHEDARQLTYDQFPTKWVWNDYLKVWTRRKQGTCIGRIYFAHPSAGEKFYLRLLLNVVCGPTSFEDIRKVNGVIYDTFQAACSALGLLDDDNEWNEVLVDGTMWCSPSQLRELFVTLLLFCEVGNPKLLWDRHWSALSEDVLYKQRCMLGMPNLILSEEQVKNYALYQIENLLVERNRSLKDFPTLPQPDPQLRNPETNKLIAEELNHDRRTLAIEANTLVSGLNSEQKKVFDIVLNAARARKSGVYFVNGAGGTGKTYLWRALTAQLRSEGEIVLAVASSGIASLLLSSGKTAHSKFCIPIQLDETTTCNIGQETELAELIRNSSLLIWDEAPMVHRYAIEAVDRTFRDLMQLRNIDNIDVIFGGKTVIFGGDFRQILPVIPKKGRQEIVDASLVNSVAIWSHCRIFNLTTNMRLLSSDMDSTSKEEVAAFSKWILDVGDGKIPTTLGDDGIDSSWIRIPDEYLINCTNDPIHELVRVTYPNLLDNFNNSEYLEKRAILAPTNENADEINDYILSLIPGEIQVFNSADRISTSTSSSNMEQASLYPIEFLNSLEFPGLPSHQLKLKEGCPIILLRNINQTNGLCNGTRLIITRMHKRVIEAKVVTGSKIGHIAYIPRVEMTPADCQWPFQLKRRQFPVKLCFAMTINKSQGQTFNQVGVYLPRPVFTHGQLYVAFSRVTHKKGLKIWIPDSSESLARHTKNIVYEEVLQFFR